MKLLFTGASSNLGQQVLALLVGKPSVHEVWHGVHKTQTPLQHPKLREIRLDLSDESTLSAIPEAIDTVVHFAGVTHSKSPERYWDINLHGTMRLARESHRAGCRRFIYISTRCIGRDAGDYGESKKSAEDALKELPWNSLVILRPSEIYGAGGKEGIDSLIHCGRTFHFVPMIFGHPRILFAPLHAEDFAKICAEIILEHPNGVTTVNLCGPESLNGVSVALRIAKRFKALPVPLWWPLVEPVLKVLGALGLGGFSPDQISRLTSQKSADRSGGISALEKPMRRFLY